METALYLHPLPPLAPPPPPGGVVEALRGCGFLGAPLEAGRWRAGEGFFDHLTLAGCSPHLVLEPRAAGDRAFTHLRLLEEAPPRLRVAPHRGRPRCPGCRAPVPDWKARLAEWRSDATAPVECPACGARSAAAELDWRRYGVAAPLLMEITCIWPGEAVPSDALLARLQQATGRPWDYAWAATGA